MFLRSYTYIGDHTHTLCILVYVQTRDTWTCIVVWRNQLMMTTSKHTHTHIEKAYTFKRATAAQKESPRDRFARATPLSESGTTLGSESLTTNRSCAITHAHTPTLTHTHTFLPDSGFVSFRKYPISSTVLGLAHGRVMRNGHQRLDH